MLFQYEISTNHLLSHSLVDCGLVTKCLMFYSSKYNFFLLLNQGQTGSVITIQEFKDGLKQRHNIDK